MKCKHCYKDNGEDIETHHMTFETFKNIFDKLTLQEISNNKYRINKSPLQQIAFGITDVTSNKDFFRMMEYSRENGIIPNYTTNGMFVTDEIAEKTAKLCGAVAVSIYNKDISYNAIEKYTSKGMTQVNIHYMLAEETYDKVFEIIKDIEADNRLKKLNAIVFLSYKPKGKGKNEYTILSDEKFSNLVKILLNKNITFGFDSCTANKFHKALQTIENNEKVIEMMKYVEPCESTCFSSYINCYGEFYACSFCEGEGMWKTGIDVLKVKDFSKEVWNNEKTLRFRDELLKNNRKCPMFDLDKKV